MPANMKVFRQPTCPWWFLFTFDNPLRRLYQDPAKFLSPLISEGDRVLDIGCGMGFLTLPAAKLVGQGGEVVAVDLQQRMLEGLSRRAEKENFQGRIRLHRAVQDRIGIEGPFDLALAFWMVHEVHDRVSFISQIRSLLRPGGKVLIAEPYLHVSRDDFLRTSSILEQTGFTIVDEPKIGFSRTLVAEKE